jgi:hypothetical protein
MSKICTDINQKDEMLFWLRELTHLSSQQAEVTLNKMHADRSSNQREFCELIPQA